MSRTVVGRLKYVVGDPDRQRKHPMEVTEQWLDDHFATKEMVGIGEYVWYRVRNSVRLRSLEANVGLDDTDSTRFRFEGAYRSEPARAWSACEL